MQLTEGQKQVLRSSHSCQPSVPETTAPKVDGARLMSSLHESCDFGKAHPWGEHPTETGMARLALSDADKDVRNWFIQQTKSIGCDVTVDQMGNIFAIRRGKSSAKPPIVMGSHLDTQPTGGRYDGILGVLGGLEVLRTLEENGIETEGDIGVVNWTNEEGARFPVITIASGVWAGNIQLEAAWNCMEITNSPDGERHTMKDELERIGFLGTTPSSYEALPIGAYFELHIEQGPILEDEGRRIGVVTGGQAYKWFEVTVKGRDCHAGTTPISARHDAVLAAAKMVVESNRIAKQAGALITTGQFNTDPGSVNTVGHTGRFTIDMRHPSDSTLADVEAACRKAFASIATEDSERGVVVEWKQLAASSAVTFHPECVAVVEASAQEACLSLTPAQASEDGGALWKRMVSGAGHDAFNVSRRCPTGMIFTPTREGLSHTPVEYCGPEDCVLGVQVLLMSVLRYDKLRAEGKTSGV